MPRKKARKSAQTIPTAAPAELEIDCAVQLRRIGDRLNSCGSVAEIAAVLAEMPGRKAYKNAEPPPSPARARAEVEIECATQFRRIGDKLNFRQKFLNLISKLFSLVT